MSSLRRLAFLLIAWLSFGLGVIGVFVPLMPTTCFMLLAVWAASKGSPRFALWIREHPRFGPAVVAWEGERAIPRHAKYLARSEERRVGKVRRGGDALVLLCNKRRRHAQYS